MGKATYWSTFASNAKRKQKELNEMIQSIDDSFKNHPGLAEYVGERDKTFLKKLRDYRGDLTFARLAKVAIIINEKPHE